MKRIMLLAALLMMTFLFAILEWRLTESTVPLEGKEETIRILITSDNFESEYHQKICLFSDEEYRVCSEVGEKQYQAKEQCQITLQDEMFSKDGRLLVQSDGGLFYFPELTRAEEGIGYAGSLEIEKTSQGMLLINELPLEAYLCGVLPSEMTAAFPLEALKAQAICARTYALEQKKEKRASKYHVDLDDSTSYQVYNNRMHSERTDLAVKETKGLVMKRNGVYMDARYYSTSCGLDLKLDLSENEVFAAFMQDHQIRSIESEEPLYRWKTELYLKELAERTGWNKIESLTVLTRSSKGAATALKINGEKENGDREEIIEGEYQIRLYLAMTEPVIDLQDGTVREGWTLLPSAFFLLEPITEQDTVAGYKIYGGGYGHGEGMSQNGAKHLAEQGMNCEEILEQYFEDMELCTDNSTVAQ